MKLSSFQIISGAVEPGGNDGDLSPLAIGDADATILHIGQPALGVKAIVDFDPFVLEIYAVCHSRLAFKD